MISFRERRSQLTWANVMVAWGRAEVDEQLLGLSSDEDNSEICRRKRPRSGYLAAYSDTSGWWLQHGHGETQTPRGVDTARQALCAVANGPQPFTAIHSHPQPSTAIEQILMLVW